MYLHIPQTAVDYSVHCTMYIQLAVHDYSLAKFDELADPFKTSVRGTCNLNVIKQQIRCPKAKILQQCQMF